MSNYSAQNLNRISINTPSSKKPTKEVVSNSQSSDALQLKVKPVEREKFDLESLLNKTILSPFLRQDDSLVASGKYDYAFHIGNHRIYSIVQEVGFESNSPKVAKSVVNKYKQQAATKLTKRFQNLIKRTTLPTISTHSSSGNTNQIATDGVASVHCIGLTIISGSYGEGTSHINHNFGSVFFQEDCVLDLDDGNNVLQIFSLDSFINIINLLQTPSDLVTFLDYHQPILVEQKSFTDEVALARTFLVSPKFFERAIKVQEKLVEIGLLAKVETRLLDIAKLDDASSDNQKVVQQTSELIQKLQSYSQMYQKLVNGFIKRYREDGNNTIDTHLQTLIDESMYTRMSIMEEVVAYAERSEDEYRNGYLRHQHSYNQFGHHYVLIVYGLVEDAEYNREYVKQNYADLLMDINSQLQDPAMDEYFILGFDMSKNDGKGNVTVEMDVFHHSGSEMSAMEKRLYDQVQALSQG